MEKFNVIRENSGDGETIKAFKSGETDKKGLQRIVNNAIKNESNKLQSNADQNYKEEREDQEYNIIAQKHYIEDILGKRDINLELNNKEVEKIEDHIFRKNEELDNRIEAIREYLAENVESMDADEYSEKVENLNEIDERISGLKHDLLSHFAFAENHQKDHYIMESKEVAMLNMQLSLLEEAREKLEEKLNPMSHSKLPLDEVDELIKELDDLLDKNKIYKNYIESDSSLN